MPIYNFEFRQPDQSMDKMPDFRSDAEKLLSPASQYNPEIADIAVVERWAEETCNISGAFVALYLRMENKSTVDEVWNESQDVVYASPKWVKGVWKPQPLSDQLTRFGVDAPNKSIITFSRASMLKDFGRIVREGDVIAVPQNEADKTSGLSIQHEYLYYRVINVTNNGQFRYRWIYTRCACEPLTGDTAWLPKILPL